MTHKTITYEQAKKRFEAGRKYEPLGTKLDRNIWIKYDSENDRFVLHYVYSKYYQTVDANGDQKIAKATASQRDKYTMREVGHIYKDHAHLFPPNVLGTNNPARNFYESHFDCTYRSIPSIKFKGFEWTFFKPGLNYWQRTHGAGTVVISGAGVRIYPGGVVAPTTPVMVRVHKKDQQKALNQHIKAVRRMVGLRAKLGGFSSVDWIAFGRTMQTTYGRSHHVVRTPKLINKLFMEIDDEDYMTMLPVLWLASALDSRRYLYSAPAPNYDWLRAFNNLVDRVRETLRKEQGAVEYVLDQQTQKSDEGAIGNEEASASSSVDG